MNHKKVIIELEEVYQASPRRYRVTRLTNTVEFDIRQTISKEEAQTLISRDHTKVVVKPNRHQKS